MVLDLVTKSRKSQRRLQSFASRHGASEESMERNAAKSEGNRFSRKFQKDVELWERKKQKIAAYEEAEARFRVSCLRPPSLPCRIHHNAACGKAVRGSQSHIEKSLKDRHRLQLQTRNFGMKKKMIESFYSRRAGRINRTAIA